ncbi:MAG: FAD-binding protein [Streptosporangiaceae bacterium]
MRSEPPSGRHCERTALTGWGRTAPTVASVARPRSTQEVAKLMAAAPGRGAIARGLGRSYGDAAQSAGGLVLDCTALAPNRAIDPESGVVTTSAGVSLDALLRELVPLGWFVPVTPGTRYVTVGGALAADIHGKNHHVDGSFGAAVLSFTLVTPGGEVRRVTPDDDRELFWATVGGMGLTGVVTEVTFRCVPVETSRMRVDIERARDLDHALEIMASSDDRYHYTVAWIDLLASGGSMGRSVLTRGDHARADELPPRARRDPFRYDPRPRLSAPPWAPPRLLNRLTVGAFNELWFRKAPEARRGEIQEIAAFFHPLDGIRRWNALYGPRGFVQYQCVVPFGEEQALRRIVERVSGSGIASFLAVLKRFGPGNQGMLSFPMSGWTLALDIPVGGAALPGLLTALDGEVLAAGGRVYLAKDAVLPAELLPRMYPELDRWRGVRRRVDPDGVLRSDLCRRLDLLSDANNLRGDQ